MWTAISSSYSKVAALGIAAAIAVPVAAQAFIIVGGFGMIGLVAGQTARLNVSNIGDPNLSPNPDCELRLMFLDGEGDTLAESRAVVANGKSAFLDLDANDLGGPDTRPGERFPVRAAVTIGKPNTLPTREQRACANSTVSTVEVFDTATGNITAVLGPPPHL